MTRSKEHNTFGDQIQTFDLMDHTYVRYDEKPDNLQRGWRSACDALMFLAFLVEQKLIFGIEKALVDHNNVSYKWDGGSINAGALAGRAMITFESEIADITFIGEDGRLTEKPLGIQSVHGAMFDICKLVLTGTEMYNEELAEHNGVYLKGIFKLG